MTDVAREKYLHLMEQVEALEDTLTRLEKEQAPQDEIRAVQEQLADGKHELARISDGCGTGRGNAM